jgi:hypothetical protein
MPKRRPNKGVTYLVDYFDYNLFGIKLVNALRKTTVGTGIILSTDSANFGSTQGYAPSVPLRQKVLKVLKIRALKLV